MRLPIQSPSVRLGPSSFVAYLPSNLGRSIRPGIRPQDDPGLCGCALNSVTKNWCRPGYTPSCQGLTGCQCILKSSSCACSGGNVSATNCPSGTTPTCQPGGGCACVTIPCTCASGSVLKNNCAQGSWPYCVGEAGCACLPVPPPCGPWDGTAPFCDGECHCGPGEYCETSPDGDGTTCLTGSKARCCPDGGGRGTCSASGSIFNCVVSSDHCNPGYHAFASTFFDGCHCYCNAPGEGSGSCLNEQQALKACGDGNYEDGGWGCQQGIKLFCKVYPEKCC
jgi:hypothetical protein